MNMFVGLGASLIANTAMKNIQNQKVNVLHASPGRVRLQCDRWKNLPTSRSLERLFQEIPLVDRVETSPVTGTLLLTFTVSTLTTQQFDQIVQQAVQASVAAYPELESDLMNIMKQLVRTVDNTVKRTSGGKLDIDSLLVVYLLLAGIAKRKAFPAFSASLIFWAYNLVAKE